jgi:hypothetical protein
LFIVITLIRKLPTDKVSRLRGRDAGPLRDLARKTARWAADHLDALKEAAPAMPNNLNDRAQDAWEPLIAIADEIGEDWPMLARAAAVTLSGGIVDDNIVSWLLADIRELFDPLPTEDNPKPQPVDKLFTAEILEALHDRDDRPWSEYGRQRKPISGAQIAALLRPPGVSTKNTIRKEAERTKGYERRHFDDAFSLTVSFFHSSAAAVAADSKDIWAARRRA